MKAAAFEFVRPNALNEVFALLDEYRDEARIIAGGQTLLATLNMRLSEPQLLIDIGALIELRDITVAGDTLSIGALVTHAQIEDSALVRRHAPLLADVAPHVAHRAIRNLGTFGGSIAFADPAAEWPTCLVALRGRVVIGGIDGTRRVDADEFFQDLYTTALRPAEIVLACEVPIAQEGFHHEFDELVRRHGDYAIVGAAVTGNTAASRTTNVRVVFLGCGNVPLRAKDVESRIENMVLTMDAVNDIAATLNIDPGADLYHSEETKRHLARVTLNRLLRKFVAAGSISSGAEGFHG
ncbi:FAD binding domain-containing protein [Caballeronia sordidicola]|uniref:Carbon monoxide dehydrogenase medium chain n=1 Tax=Caballeronia sordidicola TaxID=196367 RepID=A0A226X8J6_CABSO|nr:FAD binding domain-containing protein [Caballeronia sordidicola]OXC79805.1 Carbon monoxide dehydrogenase medium chain [Caballeronia sordidicola]